MLDLAKVTCDQWSGYKIKLQNIALWLSGYFNGARGNTVIDTRRRLAAEQGHFRDFCITNPQVPIMQAVEKVIALPAR